MGNSQQPLAVWPCCLWNDEEKQDWFTSAWKELQVYSYFFAADTWSWAKFWKVVHFKFWRKEVMAEKTYRFEKYPLKRRQPFWGNWSRVEFSAVNEKFCLSILSGWINYPFQFRMNTLVSTLNQMQQRSETWFFNSVCSTFAKTFRFRSVDLSTEVLPIHWHSQSSRPNKILNH